MGVHTFTATLTVAGSNFISAMSATGSGVSPNIQVVGGAAARFQVVSEFTQATAGNSVNTTLLAYDAYGNFASIYTGKVHFTSSDPHLIMPDAPAVWDNSYAVPFKTVGVQTLTITDTANPALTGTVSFLVSPAAPAALLLSGSPAATAEPSGATASAFTYPSGFSSNRTPPVHASSTRMR